jgi:hypothetical protein
MIDAMKTKLTKNDPVKISVDGGDWIEGVIELASENQMSLSVVVDEGIPSPCGLMEKDGKTVQVLLLSRDGDGYIDILASRPVAIQPLAAGNGSNA